jgi:hypothetical protein
MIAQGLVSSMAKYFCQDSGQIFDGKKLAH